MCVFFLRVVVLVDVSFPIMLFRLMCLLFVRGVVFLLRVVSMCIVLVVVVVKTGPPTPSLREDLPKSTLPLLWVSEGIDSTQIFTWESVFAKDPPGVSFRFTLFFYVRGDKRIAICKSIYRRICNVSDVRLDEP